MDVIIQHGGQQVVGCSDGMKVSGKMKIDIFHGNYLRVPAAGSAALQAEHRTERGLTKCHDGFLSQSAKRIRQADSSRCLSFSRRSRIDGGHEDQFSVRIILTVIQKLQIDLRFVSSVLFQIVLFYSGDFRDFADVFHLTRLCNLNIRFKSHCSLLIHS